MAMKNETNDILWYLNLIGDFLGGLNKPKVNKKVKKRSEKGSFFREAKKRGSCCPRNRFLCKERPLKL